jgi:hypothetical protein
MTTVRPIFRLLVLEIIFFSNSTVPFNGSQALGALEDPILRVLFRPKIELASI